jgi:hypothetical protein
MTSAIRLAIGGRRDRPPCYASLFSFRRPSGSPSTRRRCQTATSVRPVRRFHPATVPQGLLGNAVLEAFAAAYDPRIARFRLTDQQLLDEAGVPHAPGHTYFDVSPYVLVPDRHSCAGLAGAFALRGGGPSPAASTPAAGGGFRGAGGPLLSDPGSFLVLANQIAPRIASGDVWEAPWHAAGGPWDGTEALDRLFAVGGLAPTDRGG